MKLETDSIASELATGQSCPSVGLFAFLNVLLRHTSLILEDANTLGGTGEVGCNPGDAWTRFTRMLFPNRGREVIALKRPETRVEVLHHDLRCHQQSQGEDGSGDQFLDGEPPMPDILAQIVENVESGTTKRRDLSGGVAYCRTS